ncbi:MAG: hypothetical protein AAF236_04765 [Verrucomicrobiota bacterium]
MKIEYKTVVMKTHQRSVIKGDLEEIDEKLRVLGDAGWELVSVQPLSVDTRFHYAIYYFMRKSELAFT